MPAHFSLLRAFALLRLSRDMAFRWIYKLVWKQLSLGQLRLVHSRLYGNSCSIASVVWFLDNSFIRQGGWGGGRNRVHASRSRLFPFVWRFILMFIRTNGQKFPICSIGHHPLWVRCLKTISRWQLEQQLAMSKLNRMTLVILNCRITQAYRGKHKAKKSQA